MTVTPSVRAARRPDAQKANGMRVVEIFQSKQGEGLWTGVTSTFVRTVGCNLHCGFCDTTYASWQSERGVDLAVEEIVGRAILLGNRHVILTGGEPMIQSETVMLTELLAERKYTVTVETAGTVYLPIKCDLISISPKLSNSIPEGVSEAILKRHNTNRKRIESVRRLIAEHPYQLKFVVDQPEDLLEVEEYLKELGTASPDRVYLMPMAIDADVMNAKAEWIGAYCKGRGYRCCPRMQLVWYGNKRGT